ncbi:hypothetical protein OJ998_05545 [Solirubrobacter taibaiensis]|nr:hypothetical protein [Solirubrobacter taibaiensis]
MSQETELPRRPRRKLLTPITGGLVVVIVAAGGFAGGAKVQESQAQTTAAAGPAGGMPGGGMPTGGPPGMAGAAQTGGPTTGTVAYTKGDTLYVEDAEGNTIKVKVKSSANVTRTASTDADTIQPGDSVTIEGAANANGTVRATAVTATAAE